VGGNEYWMPLPLAALLSSFFLWVAENVGTGTGTSIYAGQGALDLVSFEKMGSWYLLLYVSFATVTLVYRDVLYDRPVTGNRARTAPEPAGQTPRSG
jgi:uncharacterized membrane protein YoaT (DUF817 family)